MNIIKNSENLVIYLSDKNIEIIDDGFYVGGTRITLAIDDNLIELNVPNPEYDAPNVFSYTSEDGWVVVDEDGYNNLYIQSRMKKADEVREKRDLLLQECDWTQLSDVPLDSVLKQEWIDYRAELRNVTSQEGFPFNVVFPIKPESNTPATSVEQI